MVDIDWVEIVGWTLVVLTQWAAYVGKPEVVAGVKFLSKIWDHATGNHHEAENNK